MMKRVFDAALRGQSSDYRAARFRLADFLIIVFCLSGAAISLNLFRLDLFQAIELQNEKPVGTIVIINNTVQRRIASRVLWDRLAVESPVYKGDLVRTAGYSAAMLYISGNSIDLDENTLIRIQTDPEGSDAFRIEMDEGRLSLNSGDGSGTIKLNLMGSEVEAGPGTVLNVAAGKEGMVLQVSEGTAQFVDGGQKRAVSSGSMLAMDIHGAEQQRPAAVMLQPLPNGRYLNNKPGPFTLNFAWNRVNLDSSAALRLEFAADRNYNRILHVINDLDTSAQAVLDAGSWYWRLCHETGVLASGRFSIADAAVSNLITPAADSLFRYTINPPAIRFQWAGLEEASHYLVEIADQPDFGSLRVKTEVTTASCIRSDLGAGTWYWRVMPVFPPVYGGSGAYSPHSVFRVELGEENIIPVDESPALPESKPETRPEPAPWIEPEIKPEPEPPVPVPIQVRLVSPAPEARLEGLAALQGPVEFRWDSDIAAVRSRFVLSRNRNPLQGQPAVQVANPGRSVRLDRLEEGLWYWTVEARGNNGLVSAAQPRQLRVLAIPLLPAPENMQPSADCFGIEHLRDKKRIDLSWAEVRGANAYIISVFEQTDDEPRQIIQTNPVDSAGWTLDNLSALNRGTFIWRVEAVYRYRDETVQRGRPAENTFIIDIPPPSVEVNSPGILYGNE